MTLLEFAYFLGMAFWLCFGVTAVLAAIVWCWPDNERQGEQSLKEWKYDAICDSMSLPAFYEAIAEEAVEVAHASLKRARVLRGENATPCSNDSTSTCLTEEISDLMLCLEFVPEGPNGEIMEQKLNRWLDRVGTRNA